MADFSEKKFESIFSAAIFKTSFIPSTKSVFKVFKNCKFLEKLKPPSINIELDNKKLRVYF